jgi:hypothetical protein
MNPNFDIDLVESRIEKVKNLVGYESKLEELEKEKADYEAQPSLFREWMKLRNKTRSLYHEALRMYLAELKVSEDSFTSPETIKEGYGCTEREFEANCKMVTAREAYLKALDETNTFAKENEVPGSMEIKIIPFFFF